MSKQAFLDKMVDAINAAGLPVTEKVVGEWTVFEAAEALDWAKKVNSAPPIIRDLVLALRNGSPKIAAEARSYAVVNVVNAATAWARNAAKNGQYKSLTSPNTIALYDAVQRLEQSKGQTLPPRSIVAKKEAGRGTT